MSGSKPKRKDERYYRCFCVNELIEMLNDVLTEEEYSDKSLHILVQDILFFYMNYVKNQELLNKKVDLSSADERLQNYM